MTNHPNRKKVYPNLTFERAAREAGARVIVLWEQPGPRNTGVAWMVGYSINGVVAIVQTFKESGGWDVYTPLARTDATAGIADALARCRAMED